MEKLEKFLTLIQDQQVLLCKRKLDKDILKREFMLELNILKSQKAGNLIRNFVVNFNRLAFVARIRKNDELKR